MGFFRTAEERRGPQRRADREGRLAVMDPAQSRGPRVARRGARRADRQDRGTSWQEFRQGKAEGRQTRREADRQDRRATRQDRHSLYDRATGAAAVTEAEEAQQKALDDAQALLDEDRTSLIDPYTEAGEGALGAQGDLLGLNGPEAQAAAITALESSPMFTSLLAQGENSILQNASATGGLRGGNTQGALAQFSPALLSSVIQNQLGSLGDISGMGVGAAGMGAGFEQEDLRSQLELLMLEGDLAASADLGRYETKRKSIRGLTDVGIEVAGLFKGGRGRRIARRAVKAAKTAV